ncbi:ABC transporter permease [Paucibacter sp. O1-1]|nr:ABC transporter permease [Paucibacter sp. O1-1]MDA3831540.1 ABC transporter permease [Paucibacter sp. O1-1]
MCWPVCNSGRRPAPSTKPTWQRSTRCCRSRKENVQLLPHPGPAQPAAQPGPQRADGDRDRAGRRRLHDHLDGVPRVGWRSDPAQERAALQCAARCRIDAQPYGPWRTGPAADPLRCRGLAARCARPAPGDDDRRPHRGGPGRLGGAGVGRAAPFLARARWTSSDFFAIFEAPLLHGRGWSAAEDQSKARVAVVSRALAEQLFGQADAVGRTLRLRDKDLTIIGVLADWRPAPHYFDLTLGAYESAAQVFAPLLTALDLDFGSSGDLTCWATAPTSDPWALNAPCAWLQYWVELKDPAASADYLAYLQRYSEQQRSAGRFERPANPRLTPVMDWLAQRQVVPSDIRLQLWLALGFLLVCLSNTVGLLLAKCLRRSGEIGVRRALGASKRAIFWQFLVEAGVLGLVGGLLGLALTWAGLAAVRLNPTPYAQLAQLDWAMLGATLAVALAAALAAGLLPAWRACQVMPAIQLKSQ